jgi:hypothetical protein
VGDLSLSLSLCCVSVLNRTWEEVETEGEKEKKNIKKDLIEKIVHY